MQIWNFFLFFALAAILFWALGAFFSWKGKKALAVGATVAGLVVFLSYIICGLLSTVRRCARWERRVCGTRSSCR